jgi:protein-disulfide isomerase
MRWQRSTQGRRGNQEEHPAPWQGVVVAFALILLMGLVSALLSLTMLSRGLAATQASAMTRASRTATSVVARPPGPQAGTPVRLTVEVSDRDHAQGPATAPVTLVEYGDYQCPACIETHSIVKQVEQAMGNRMRFVFRNYPLKEYHPHAQAAAEAAEAAAAQGAFWEMHDILYQHPTALDDEHLVLYAQSIGLNVVQFQQNLAQHTYAPRVAQDAAGGDASGVHTAPAFFINGVPYDGDLSYDSFLKALQDRARGGG